MLKRSGSNNRCTMGVIITACKGRGRGGGGGGREGDEGDRSKKKKCLKRGSEDGGDIIRRILIESNKY